LRLCHPAQVLDTRGRLLTALGYGLWPSMVLLSEIVQTSILADFCYYYIKRWIKHCHNMQHNSWYALVNYLTLFPFGCSLVGGQLVLRLPSGVVWF